MKFTFKEKDPAQIRDKIVNALGGRELGNIVKFDLNGSRLEITISKLGTSKLCFDAKSSDKGLTFALAEEKIAFTHRAFKDEVKRKICNVIESVGGTITES